MRIELDPSEMHELAGRYRWAGAHVAEIGGRTLARAANSDLLAAQGLTAVWHQRFVEGDLLNAGRRIELSAGALMVLDAIEIDAAALAVLVSQGAEAAWHFGAAAVALEIRGVAIVEGAMAHSLDRRFGTSLHQLQGPGDNGDVRSWKIDSIEVQGNVTFGGKGKIQILREIVSMPDGSIRYRVHLIGEGAALATLGVGATLAVGKTEGAGADIMGEGGGKADLVWDFPDEQSVSHFLSRVKLHVGADLMMGPGAELAMQVVAIGIHDWSSIPPPTSWFLAQQVTGSAHAEAGVSSLVGDSYLGAAATGSITREQVYRRGSSDGTNVHLSLKLEGKMSPGELGLPVDVQGSGELSVNVHTPPGGILPRLDLEVDFIRSVDTGRGGANANQLVRDSYAFSIDLGALPDSPAARHLIQATSELDSNGMRLAIAELQAEHVFDYSHHRYHGEVGDSTYGLDAGALVDLRGRVSLQSETWKKEY